MRVSMLPSPCPCTAPHNPSPIAARSAAPCSGPSAAASHWPRHLRRLLLPQHLLVGRAALLLLPVVLPPPELLQLPAGRKVVPSQSCFTGIADRATCRLRHDGVRVDYHMLNLEHRFTGSAAADTA